MRRLLPALLILLLLISCGSAEDDEAAFAAVAADFPSYDAARAVLGDSAAVTMLLPPGTESHSYDPTPRDMIRIAEADLVVYTGGPSDEWVRSILSSLDDPPASFALTEQVQLLYEEHKEGMEEEEDHDHQHSEHEVDEHVWTSLENMASIISDLSDLISSMDSENSAYYEKNSSDYINSIMEIKKEIENVVESAKRNLIVVADRFPLLYFVNEFSLSYYAAFPGCASGTEPSAKTVAFLIDKIREEHIPAVLHIELSNTLLSSLIADETGTEVYEINSAQNISRRDFNNGVTYLDLMRKNLSVLKEVLN